LLFELFYYIFQSIKLCHDFRIEVLVLILSPFQILLEPSQMERTSRSKNAPIYHMKVVLLGQTSVGKSSLVLRFVQDKFFPNGEGTIGAAYLTRIIELQDRTNVRMEIWDTAGQERYHSLAPMYYRGAQAAIVVCDITSRESLEKAKTWVNELKESRGNTEQVIAFVVNKCDLESSRTLDKNESLKYAEENNLLFMETSAKDGTNVHQLFYALAERLPKQSENFQASANAGITVYEEKSSKDSGCC